MPQSSPDLSESESSRVRVTLGKVVGACGKTIRTLVLLKSQQVGFCLANTHTHAVVHITGFLNSDVLQIVMSLFCIEHWCWVGMISDKPPAIAPGSRVPRTSRLALGLNHFNFSTHSIFQHANIQSMYNLDDHAKSFNLEASIPVISASIDQPFHSDGYLTSSIGYAPDHSSRRVTLLHPTKTHKHMTVKSLQHCPAVLHPLPSNECC